MKTIFITISRGALIRNFFQTNIISKILKYNIKVIILTPYCHNKEIFGKYSNSKNLFFEPLIKSKEHKRIAVKAKKILLEFFKGVIFSKTVLARYKYRFTGKSPRRIFYLPRVVFFAILKFIPGIKRFLRQVDFFLFPQKEHDYLFKKYKPDLVFVTDLTDSADIGVLKSAKRFNIKTIGMPKSWDNLSKILFRVKTDYLFVWGEFSKKEAMKYQDYSSEEIVITGPPQFDYYQRKNLINKDEFYKKLKLTKNKPIILYGSTGPHYQRDYQFIELILDFIQYKNINAQILIRPHPGYIGDEDRFLKFKNISNVSIQKHKQNLNLRDKWDISENHLKYLYASFYYADVLINIASTLTLDALAVGTPVINLCFDLSDKNNKNESAIRFYKTDYIKAIAEFGGSYVVKNQAELFQALEEILVKKHIKRKQMGKMVHYFTYKNDCQAGERIIKNILNILHRKV